MDFGVILSIMVREDGDGGVFVFRIPGCRDSGVVGAHVARIPGDRVSGVSGVPGDRVARGAFLKVGKYK